MVGHRRVAVSAFDRFLAGNAVNEIGIAAAIEKQNGLLLFVNGDAEEMLKALGEDVNPAAGAHPCFSFKIDQFNVRHGQTAHAIGEGKEVVEIFCLWSVVS
jgi:hypothetical protein